MNLEAEESTQLGTFVRNGMSVGKEGGVAIVSELEVEL